MNIVNNVVLRSSTNLEFCKICSWVPGIGALMLVQMLVTLIA